MSSQESKEKFVSKELRKRKSLKSSLSLPQEKLKGTPSWELLERETKMYRNLRMPRDYPLMSGLRFTLLLCIKDTATQESSRSCSLNQRLGTRWRGVSIDRSTTQGSTRYTSANDCDWQSWKKWRLGNFFNITEQRPRWQNGSSKKPWNPIRKRRSENIHHTWKSHHEKRGGNLA